MQRMDKNGPRIQLAICPNLRMINDRLLELKTIIASSPQPKEPGTKIDVPQLYQNQFLPDFQTFIKNLQKHQQKIQASSVLINDCAHQYQKATTPEHEKKISAKVNETAKKSQLTRSDMQGLIKKMSSHLKSLQGSEDETEIRHKENSIRAWNSAMIESIERLSKAENDFKAVVKMKVSRQIKTIQPDLSQEEVGTLAEDPDIAQQMIQEQVIGASSALSNRLADIQDKLRDIKYLSRCVDELFELTVQMSRLVAEAGQKLQTIEQDLIGAKDYVESADEKLEKAKEHHKSFRKKMCCFILIGIIVIGAVLAPILITQIK